METCSIFFLGWKYIEISSFLTTHYVMTKIQTILSKYNKKEVETSKMKWKDSKIEPFEMIMNITDPDTKSRVSNASRDRKHHSWDEELLLEKPTGNRFREKLQTLSVSRIVWVNNEKFHELLLFFSPFFIF